MHGAVREKRGPWAAGNRQPTFLHTWKAVPTSSATVAGQALAANRSMGAKGGGGSCPLLRAQGLGQRLRLPLGFFRKWFSASEACSSSHKHLEQSGSRARAGPALSPARQEQLNCQSSLQGQLLQTALQGCKEKGSRAGRAPCRGGSVH